MAGQIQAVGRAYVLLYALVFSHFGPLFETLARTDCKSDRVYSRSVVFVQYLECKIPFRACHAHKPTTSTTNHNAVFLFLKWGFENVKC